MEVSGDLEQGLATVRAATELDGAGLYGQALPLYELAVQCFSRVLLDEPNPARRTVLQRKVAEYQARMLELRQSLVPNYEYSRPLLEPTPSLSPSPSPSSSSSLARQSPPMQQGYSSSRSTPTVATSPPPQQYQQSAGGGGSSAALQFVMAETRGVELPPIGVAFPNAGANAASGTDLASVHGFVDIPTPTHELDDEDSTTSIYSGAAAAAAAASGSNLVVVSAAPMSLFRSTGPVDPGAVAQAVQASEAAREAASAKAKAIASATDVFARGEDDVPYATYADMGIVVRGPAPVEREYKWHAEKDTEMHQLFPYMPADERCLEWYSCSLGSVLVLGILFITKRYLCFAAHIQEVREIMYLEDILTIEKKAGMFMDSICVHTKMANYEFTSFRNTDNVYRVLLHMRRLPDHVFSHSATFSITFPELNQRFHEIFRLPSFELLAAHYPISIEGFECSLYMTKSFICLHRLEPELKDMIPLRFLARVERKPGVMLRKDLAIITTGCREYRLSFMSGRDEAYDRVMYLWHRYLNRPVIFGIKLEDLLEREGLPTSAVPKVIEHAGAALRTYGLGEAGLFSLPVPEDDLTDYSQQLDEGIQLDFPSLPVHMVAAIFKRFFRFLPEPVITNFLQPEFLAAADIADSAARIDRLRALVLGITDDDSAARIPEANRSLLKFAVQLLVEVSHYSEVNEMDAQRLAAIFATLFGRETSALAGQSPADVVQKLALIVQDMIENYSQIFTLL